MTVLRSVLFALGLLLITPPYALIALATFPLPRMARYRIISGWSRLVILLAVTVPPLTENELEVCAPVIVVVPPLERNAPPPSAPGSAVPRVKGQVTRPGVLARRDGPPPVRP